MSQFRDRKNSERLPPKPKIQTSPPKKFEGTIRRSNIAKNYKRVVQAEITACVEAMRMLSSAKSQSVKKLERRVVAGPQASVTKDRLFTGCRIFLLY